MKPSDIGPGPGPGEAAARDRQRRTLINFGTIAAVGFFVGLAAALVESKDAPLSAGGTMPAWFAILAVVLTVGAMAVGSWYYYRNMDELQRLDNYWAASLGAHVFLAGFPVWLILWKGGLLPEPNAFVLYGATWATVFLGLLWRKFR